MQTLLFKIGNSGYGYWLSLCLVIAILIYYIYILSNSHDIYIYFIPLYNVYLTALTLPVLGLVGPIDCRDNLGSRSALNQMFVYFNGKAVIRDNMVKAEQWHGYHHAKCRVFRRIANLMTLELGSKDTSYSIRYHFRVVCPSAIFTSGRGD